MDHAGIDVACINCIFYGDARYANDLVAELCARRPDRFVPVAFVTPHYPDEAVRELERAFDQLGMKYLKIYPDYFRKPNDDPAYFPIYEWLNERGLAVMMHATYSFDPPGVTPKGRFTALSERFPNVRWVLAHAGGLGPREGHRGRARPPERLPGDVRLRRCPRGDRELGQEGGRRPGPVRQRHGTVGRAPPDRQGGHGRHIRRGQAQDTGAECNRTVGIGCPAPK